MPVYDYLCSACGPFSEVRPMAEYDLPQDCPDCGASSPRVILTAPHFSGLSAERRLVHATNERNAHAPRTSTQFRAEKAEHASRHDKGCSCCSGKGRKMSRLTARGGDGSMSFPTSRPWMISH